MRPAASCARRSSSSNPETASISASMPPSGVPTLLPRPSMTSLFGYGDTISSDSRPRTQRGTFTGSARTFSSPSSRIVRTAHAMASSSACEPLKRCPNVSVSSARRFHAKLSASAAPIRRAARSRYVSSQGIEDAPAPRVDRAAAIAVATNSRRLRGIYKEYIERFEGFGVAGTEVPAPHRICHGSLAGTSGPSSTILFSPGHMWSRNFSSGGQGLSHLAPAPLLVRQPVDQYGRALRLRGKGREVRGLVLRVVVMSHQADAVECHVH